MKEIRMVKFLEQFTDSTKISVSDLRGNIFYNGTVGDAPRSVWMHKNLVSCVYSKYGMDFIITVEPRPFKESPMLKQKEV